MVSRKYRPPADLWDDPAPGTHTWLQAWYAMQTDGDWEHEFGITLSTLDNPGWSVSVELEETSAADLSYPKQELHRSEHDWYVVGVDRKVFQAACGPLNLGKFCTCSGHGSMASSKAEGSPLQIGKLPADVDEATSAPATAYKTNQAECVATGAFDGLPLGACVVRGPPAPFR